MDYRQYLRENYKKTKAELAKQKGSNPSKGEVYGILKRRYAEGPLPANELPKQPTVVPVEPEPKKESKPFNMKAFKKTAAWMISL